MRIHEDPAWSPRGDKIASARIKDSLETIYLMNADGSGMEELTPAGVCFDLGPCPADQSWPALTRNVTESVTATRTRDLLLPSAALPPTRDVRPPNHYLSMISELDSRSSPFWKKTAWYLANRRSSSPVARVVTVP